MPTLLSSHDTHDVDLTIKTWRTKSTRNMRRPTLPRAPRAACQLDPARHPAARPQPVLQASTLKRTQTSDMQARSRRWDVWTPSINVIGAFLMCNRKFIEDYRDLLMIIEESSTITEDSLTPTPMPTPTERHKRTHTRRQTPQSAP